MFCCFALDTKKKDVEYEFDESENDSNDSTDSSQFSQTSQDNDSEKEVFRQNDLIKCVKNVQFTCSNNININNEFVGDFSLGDEEKLMIKVASNNSTKFGVFLQQHCMEYGVPIQQLSKTTSQIGKKNKNKNNINLLSPSTSCSNRSNNKNKNNIIAITNGKLLIEGVFDIYMDERIIQTVEMSKSSNTIGFGNNSTSDDDNDSNIDSNNEDDDIKDTPMRDNTKKSRRGSGEYIPPSTPTPNTIAKGTVTPPPSSNGVSKSIRIIIIVHQVL